MPQAPPTAVQRIVVQRFFFLFSKVNDVQQSA